MTPSIIKFESLPNELMLECFQYFDALDLFYSFDELNSRFNRLIRITPLYLDFQYAQKHTFDQFCQKMQSNPEIKQQISSLHLSDPNTCIALEKFLSDFPLNEFIHLRSLTTTGIHPDMTKKINSTLLTLFQLESFHLIDPHDKTLPVSIIPFNNSLKTLTIPTFMSSITYNSRISSLLHLTIVFGYIYTLQVIFKHLPMLIYLNIKRFFQKNRLEEKNLVDVNALHLKQLIIGDYEGSFEDFQKLIKQIPNLKNLTLSNRSQSTDFIDAWRWEYLITTSLPQLIVFKFQFVVPYKLDISDQFKQFQSDYWIKEHHWYTEYIFDKTKAYIYTIPYFFNTYVLRSGPIEYYKQAINKLNSFDNVTELTIYDILLTVEDRMYFSNVKTLRLIHKSTDKEEFDIILRKKYIQSLKTMMNLSNLTHLLIESNDRFDLSSILLDVLKEAPLLSSLTIPIVSFVSWYDNHQLCNYLNRMIKKVRIYQNNLPIFVYWIEMDRFCEIFANIEQLICPVVHKDQVLFLLKHLPKLTYMQISSFLFYMATDWSRWFQEHVPELNLSFIATSDSLDRNKLYIWISRSISSVTHIEEQVSLGKSSLLPRIAVSSSQAATRSQRLLRYLRRFSCISSSTKDRSSIRIRK